MTYDDKSEDEGHMIFNNGILRWPADHHPTVIDYHQDNATTQDAPNSSLTIEMPLQAVVSSTASATHPTTSSSVSTTPLPTVNTTNPAIAPPPPILDPTKQYHPEWGVIKDQDFHPLTLKHQRDLENSFNAGSAIADFYFWQANLGGYCMADMVQGVVVSSEGAFVLERKIVEGAPHPGRRKKKRGLG
ncbi:MAG: hypothetical protein EXX96DRAFT_567921 [Benjaminiella poitrasii]|nr:MAG: hypothetical protein EXX96DRAFT_567921 [Benjaminiella poitrasii]